MIRKPAIIGDNIRLLVPNMDATRVLPPGTLLRVEGHYGDQPSGCLVSVYAVPEPPLEYNIVVPRGSKVNVHEE
jgi:hypothetical protein